MRGAQHAGRHSPLPAASLQAACANPGGVILVTLTTPEHPDAGYALSPRLHSCLLDGPSIPMSYMMILLGDAGHEQD